MSGQHCLRSADWTVERKHHASVGCSWLWRERECGSQECDFLLVKSCFVVVIIGCWWPVTWLQVWSSTCVHLLLSFVWERGREGVRVGCRIFCWPLHSDYFWFSSELYRVTFFDHPGPFSASQLLNSTGTICSLVCVWGPEDRGGSSEQWVLMSSNEGAMEFRKGSRKTIQEKPRYYLCKLVMRDVFINLCNINPQ